MVPQIRKLFRDDMFNNLLKGDEKKAWEAFRPVLTNFLGNIRVENYKELIEDILTLYHKLGCNMSLKIHMLHSHFDIISQTWLQYVLKDTHASFPLGFLPQQLRRG